MNEYLVSNRNPLRGSGMGPIRHLFEEHIPMPLLPASKIPKAAPPKTFFLQNYEI
jgi:hypothetical protein